METLSQIALAAAMATGQPNLTVDFGGTYVGADRLLQVQLVVAAKEATATIACPKYSGDSVTVKFTIDGMGKGDAWLGGPLTPFSRRQLHASLPNFKIDAGGVCGGFDVNLVKVR